MRKSPFLQDSIFNSFKKKRNSSSSFSSGRYDGARCTQIMNDVVVVPREQLSLPVPIMQSVAVENIKKTTASFCIFLFSQTFFFYLFFFSHGLIKCTRAVILIVSRAKAINKCYPVSARSLSRASANLRE